ncbi:hypothetical protein [Streptomyces cirratus]|uniref:hypothetical protein n=1 Tax=Streptomyces cirratus TaxID=68187 RepID=UPI001E5E3367|nr:hypothetical protein [Streptomyces cirratus]
MAEASPADRCGAAPNLESAITTSTPDQPGPIAPVRRTNAIGRVLLGGVSGVLLTVTVLTVLWWPRTEVTYRSTAPTTIAYSDESAHFLTLVHQHSLSGRESYRMVIGRSPGVSYGHWLDVDTALGAKGIESTTWTESGVRVRFPTRHEVFVPARFFLGGR